MNKQTVYTKYRFSGINNLVFADDNKFYMVDGLQEKEVKYKNGRNGLYINRQFISLKRLRKLAYKHTEIIKQTDTSDCPF